MNKTCAKWRDQLLEAALGEKASHELDAHLSWCGNCATELTRLRGCCERLDARLPSLAGAEPSADLTNRILASTRSAAAREHASVWRLWTIAGAAAVVLFAAMIGWILSQQTNPLDAAPSGAIALAHWQAPTDVLLQVPNHELLNSIPKLGDSYLTIPVEIQKGEKQ
ncbi:MAG TPA: hypothetical protein VJA94_19880 [Candidatus Angelobacter sp.]